MEKTRIRLAQPSQIRWLRGLRAGLGTLAAAGCPNHLLFESGITAPFPAATWMACRDSAVRLARQPGTTRKLITFGIDYVADYARYGKIWGLLAFASQRDVDFTYLDLSTLQILARNL